MLISKDPNQGNYQIKSYEAGKIVINDQPYKKSVIISPEILIDNWPPQSLDEMKESDLNTIFSLNPEIVLLGTGEHIIFLDPKFTGLFLQRSIGVEVMDTAAACRTFNVLMSEGRNAVAALFIK